MNPTSGNQPALPPTFSPFKPSSLQEEEAAVREMMRRHHFDPMEHGYGFSGAIAFNRILQRAEQAMELEQRVAELEGALQDLTSGVIA